MHISPYGYFLLASTLSDIQLDGASPLCKLSSKSILRISLVRGKFNLRHWEIFLVAVGRLTQGFLATPQLNAADVPTNISHLFPTLPFSG